MATQITWHSLRWGYDAGCIRSVEDLSTSRAVNVERNQDKEGEPATQTVALDLATISFSYTVAAAAGGNPRKEYETVNECIGVHAPLYLNGSKFLANEMMLKSVDASDWVLDSKGRAVSVKISVKFEEYAVDASGLKLQKVNRKSALRPGVQTAPKATSALSVGATSTQKAAKATKNKQMARW